MEKHIAPGDHWTPTRSIGGTASSPLGRITETAIERQRNTIPHTGYRHFSAFALVYVLAGNGTYADELGENRDLVPGDLILVFPELGHRYGPVPGGEWVERYVVFEGPVFEMWRDQGLLDHRHPVSHLAEIDRWNREIDHLFGGSGRIGTIPPLQEICRLQVLISRMIDHAENGTAESGNDREWLGRASALLDRAGSGDDEQDLRTIAHDLTMTYEGFRKKFRRLSGTSPARYRSERTIDRACEMLHLGLMSDREIADALGFCDEHYFSRRFRQLMGRSPRAYRRLRLTATTTSPISELQ